MQILPVLDLMHDQVVRGVAGRRQDYRPIVSRLTRSAKPLDVALAFREQFGLSELYLADLDAIAGNRPALSVYSDLLQLGFRVWVDAGLSHAGMLAAIGVQQIVAGLESLSGPREWQELIQIHGSSRLVFSLDLHNGKPLGKNSWNAPDAWGIARQAVELGARRVLVLDLAAVGVNQGTPTAELCVRLRANFPDLQIATGGGIRDLNDLRQLAALGVDHVLAASALHDGRLTASDVAEVPSRDRAGNSHRARDGSKPW